MGTIYKNNLITTETLKIENDRIEYINLFGYDGRIDMVIDLPSMTNYLTTDGKEESMHQYSDYTALVADAMSDVWSECQPTAEMEVAIIAAIADYANRVVIPDAIEELDERYAVVRNQILHRRSADDRREGVDRYQFWMRQIDGLNVALAENKERLVSLVCLPTNDPEFDEDF
jgi:hypothetical protein